MWLVGERATPPTANHVIRMLLLIRKIDIDTESTDPECPRLMMTTGERERKGDDGNGA